SNQLDSGRCCRFISSSGSTTEPSWSARTRSSANEKRLLRSNFPSSPRQTFELIIARPNSFQNSGMKFDRRGGDLLHFSYLCVLALEVALRLSYCWRRFRFLRYCLG